MVAGPREKKMSNKQHRPLLVTFDDVLWDKPVITLKTKCALFTEPSSLQVLLLDGSDTWTPYNLEQRHGTQNRATNIEVLSRAGMAAVSTMVTIGQFCWAVHVEWKNTDVQNKLLCSVA